MTLAVEELVALGPVVAVVAVEDAADAVPLARALVAGGLRPIEVTLRTPAALEAIRRIADAVPDAVVGAGTVIAPQQVDEAVKAGARFLVSPGATPALLDALAAAATPFLPGVSTASEVVGLLERGITVAKLFPAEASGGVQLLRALAGPFPDVRFCPTGGIDARRAPGYLELVNVACVGGSWMAPPAAIRAGAWEQITALSRDAMALSGGASGLRSRLP